MRAGEAGSALLVTMLLLALMGIIGLSSLNTVMRDRQVAGFQNQAQSALYAADAGIAEGLDVLRSEVLGSSVIVGECLGNDITNVTLANGAAYGPDGGAGICLLANADPCDEIEGSLELGFFYQIWNIQAQGTSPGGNTANIQTGAQRCHAFTASY